jgi:hypothetical protein
MVPDLVYKGQMIYLSYWEETRNLYFLANQGSKFQTVKLAKSEIYFGLTSKIPDLVYKSQIISL